ncbi:MAG: hypothetical protein JSS68_06935 [Actinobacteria bacterium]|nr:hypothetical protein [Actinomycetota bacterium]
MPATFDGTWRIDLDRSVVWDAEAGAYVADQIGDEVIRLRIDGDVQDYEVEYGSDPVVRMGYESRYDDPEWVPYLVREVRSSSEDVEASVAAMRRRIKADSGARERHFEVGRAYGLVRTVGVDERTHYRLSKSPEDGGAQSVMMRRLSDDGDSYLASVLTVDGHVFRRRWFSRV